MIVTNDLTGERVFNVAEWLAFIDARVRLSQRVAHRRRAMHTAYRAKTRRRGSR